MKNNLTNRLVKTGLVAAIYVVVTLIIAPIAYGNLQFRLSEILVLLAFVDPLYIIGLTLGCFIANFNSPLGAIDVVLGTLATFLSVASIYLTSKYMKSNKISLLIASLWPTIFNGIIVGWELNFMFSMPLILSIIQVAFGEFVVVSIIGVPLMTKLFKKYSFKVSERAV
ncbi:QueT transporter family protein [Caproiciproducens sp. MSJ-32]|uniref:QueT transporter family protein n=1 Tax=Caproiciproducens sp. MSJ-32 TaxID=2841527 RepID=UPI001C0F6439|nr:QueT transporter family protein [Caproiciproducens sp. MSJ-32]MBU5455875.1 QueT transporter family protein [Caproiciproducens sp. MSJ-32]